MKQRCMEREMTMELVVGVFMVMVFLGLAYFTVLLSRESWFTRKQRMEVVFADIMGLQNGELVVLRGMPVGKVKGLELENDGVHVICSLEQPVRLREGYRARVDSASMLGGKQLTLVDGPPDQPYTAEGATLYGETPHDLMADAAEAVHAARKMLAQGQTLVTNLQAASLSLREIAERVNSGQGSLGKLLSGDDTVYTNLAASVASLKEVTGRLERGEGTLGRLLSKDDTVYTNLAAVVASLKDVTGRLDRGEGSLGRLLSKDDTVYRDLADAVGSLRQITAQVQKGEGVLGRLVNDNKLYDELVKAIGELRGWIDDSRETSPVVNFSSIFFGAF
jgi:phospholipid/cholesterol/gamma-HCH transport system substrate-binding protein